jgi:hypothetical protein
LSVKSTERRRRGATGAGLVLACIVSALPACGTRDFDNENDRLRRLALDQEAQIKALRSERSELLAKLAGAERAREAALDPDVLDAIPRCAGIGLDALSGLQRPREGERGGPKVVGYVDPFDGRQRFVQIVGTLTVDAIIAGPTGDAAPVVVHATLGPAEVRDAYRTSITGYYYLVEVPVEAGAVPAGGTVTIRARFVDALTGQSHDAQTTSQIR